VKLSKPLEVERLNLLSSKGSLEEVGLNVLFPSPPNPDPQGSSELVFSCLTENEKKSSCDVPLFVSNELVAANESSPENRSFFEEDFLASTVAAASSASALLTLLPVFIVQSNFPADTEDANAD